jgi:ATP citrate (pro-S)-lyase
MFTSSQAIIYGRHLDVAQRMLDFDFLSSRSPSVAGIIDPNTLKTSVTKLFFGNSEILIPVYRDYASIPKNPSIDTCINMASFRSATEATWGAMRSGLFQNVVIIAEGIPEREIREIIAYNEANQQLRIIGPATAGAIAAGSLRMGNS